MVRDAPLLNMNQSDLQDKILYFEMHTHPPDKSALFFTKGWAKMDASKSGHVSISWPHDPGNQIYKSVTLMPEVVAQFKKNASRKTYEIHGQKIIPDFTYIETPVCEV